MSYSVLPMDATGHRASVLGLWQRNFPTASQGRYTWLYENGPATGWLLRSEQGEPVGATGLMERTLRYRGRMLRAGQAIDLNVDPDHRTVGPALGLQRAVTGAVRSGRFDLIYAMPNATSEPVLSRIGYQTLGHVGRWFKPLHWGVLMKDRARHPLTRGVAAAAVDAALRLNPAEVFRRRKAGIGFEVTDRFDGRFDDLWQRAADELSIVGERTSTYLRWRFARCPDQSHRVCCLTDADGRLLAYLVYCVRDAVACVNDFFFADAAHFDLLLAEFIRYVRPQGAAAIVAVFLGPRKVSDKLRRFGFWRRPSDWKTLLYFDRRRFEPADDGLLDPERWYLTRADIDTDA